MSAPPGMFQSKCTYAGGPIPPSSHSCTSSPSSNSNRCPISLQASASLQTGMSCLKTSCNLTLVSTLQIISFCPSQTFTRMISPQSYQYAYCRNFGVFSQPQFTAKMPSCFMILPINLSQKIFTLRPKRVGHQQILRTHWLRCLALQSLGQMRINSQGRPENQLLINCCIYTLYRLIRGQKQNNMHLLFAKSNSYYGRFYTKCF